jgi:hypothetical protein
MPITNLNTCNNILSLKKYIATYPYYESIDISGDIINIIHNNTINMHTSMGLSWNLYGECTTNLYTLYFKAKSNNNLSYGKKFKIYVGKTEKDWIVSDNFLTNEWTEFKLTTNFYFEKKSEYYKDITTGFRIGFEFPEPFMEYSIKDLQFVLGTNILKDLNYDVRIYYIEPYYTGGGNWDYGHKIENKYIKNSESITNYANNYNSLKNILIQPFRFIIEEEIKESDIFIVFEPPCCIDNPWTLFIKELIKTYSKLFKLTAIYFYEFPPGYEHHRWKLQPDFLKNFTMIFSQIAAICDNSKYFWTPVNTFLTTDYNIIDYKKFSEKKFICNDPISSGYNQRRLDIVLQYAKYYDIDVFGRMFIGRTNKFKDFIDKEKRGDRSLNKANILKNYKFIIVCENCYEYGYVSERLFDTMIAGSVPIYFGNNIDFLFTDKIGIINGRQFQNIDMLHKYLLSIDNDAYNKMVKSNLKFIKNNINYFKWDKIWHFIFDKVLKTGGSNKLEEANINLINKNNYIKETIVLLEDSEGVKNKYTFF